MLQRPALWAIAFVLAVAPACETGRRSAAGFRLPPDGDAERGKAAFIRLGCNQCHDIPGVELPQHPARSQRVLKLGGEVPREPGDGRLVRSIISPQPARNSMAAMPHYAEQMTVRDLTDIVALLQSRYVLRRLTPTWTYY